VTNQAPHNKSLRRIVNNFRNDQIGFSHGSHRQSAYGNIRDPAPIEISEPIVGGRFQKALGGTRIVSVPLAAAVGELKKLDEEIYRVAEMFFG
jgi:hypothetical protein